MTKTADHPAVGLGGAPGSAADNLAVARVTVRARLRLVKQAARTRVRAGGRVAYTIRATNTSAHAAANVRQRDTPAPG